MAKTENWQIKALRTEAISHGDYGTADMCDRALTSDDDLTDQDGNRVALAEISQSQARANVAKYIQIGKDAE